MFSFFTGSTTHVRFADFRDWLVTEKVPHAKEMIIHDVRRIVLRQIERTKGTEAA